jgi:hypothetical protein
MSSSLLCATAPVIFIVTTLTAMQCKQQANCLAEATFTSGYWYCSLHCLWHVARDHPQRSTRL